MARELEELQGDTDARIVSEGNTEQQLAGVDAS